MSDRSTAEREGEGHSASMPVPDVLAQTIRAFVEAGGYEVCVMSDGLPSAVPMDTRGPLAALDELLALASLRLPVVWNGSSKPGRR